MNVIGLEALGVNPISDNGIYMKYYLGGVASNNPFTPASTNDLRTLIFFAPIYKDYRKQGYNPSRSSTNSNAHTRNKAGFELLQHIWTWKTE